MRFRCEFMHCLCLSLAVVLGCGSGTETKSERAADQLPSTATPGSTAWPTAKLPAELPAPAQPREPRSDDWFEDVTERSGIRFGYRNGCEAGHFTLLETVGGGVALFDCDGDGDLDVFVTGGGRIEGNPIQVFGRSSALFRNDGDWRFTEITAESGLDTKALYSHGCEVGDFDRDGFPDLIVTGFGGCQLWHNDGGRRFKNVTELAGLKANDWSTSAAWADFDRDGWLDLYVANYAEWQPGKPEICLHDKVGGKYRDTCAPSLYSGQRDRLWRNRRDGTFEDVTEQAGLLPAMRGMGVVAGDFDADGWIDYFVVNDVHENQLYWGTGQLPFREGAVLVGAALSPTGEREGSMGVELADFNGDGRTDLFYTNFAGQDNSLLLANEKRGFLNVTSRWGLSGPSRRWVGFGTVAADFDLDGWPDLCVANGHVLYAAPTAPYHQPAQLFRNDAGTRMLDVSEQGGTYFSVPHVGRGVAVGDLDNNGTPDLVIVHQNDPVALLRNRHSSPHILKLTLCGAVSNLDAIGSRVMVQQAGRRWVQWVRGGGSYLSHSDVRLQFALPTMEPAEVTVTWPSGATEVFSVKTWEQALQLKEGTSGAISDRTSK